MKGRVKWYDTSKGFGFIHTEEGFDVFVHYSGIVDDYNQSLDEGEEVVFDIQDGRRGPHAVNVSRNDG